MKVYFAGSIRGGRADAELYQRIIEYIKQTDVVLTEHVGNPEFSCIMTLLFTDVQNMSVPRIRNQLEAIL